MKIKQIFINISEEPVDLDLYPTKSHGDPRHNISIPVHYTYAFSMQTYLNKNYPSDTRR